VNLGQSWPNGSQSYYSGCTFGSPHARARDVTLTVAVADFYDVTFLLRAAKRSLIYGACSYVRKVEAKSIWLITAFHRCLIHVL